MESREGGLREVAVGFLLLFPDSSLTTHVSLSHSNSNSEGRMSRPSGIMAARASSRGRDCVLGEGGLVREVDLRPGLLFSLPLFSHHARARSHLAHVQRVLLARVVALHPAVGHVTKLWCCGKGGKE
jgi:hypothetical protein